MDAYRATRAPDHVAAGFPTDCRRCHSARSWTGKGFDHSRFPLTGAHAALACQSCHGDGVYVGKSADCVACHRGDYDGTTNPNHAAAGFPLACASCHGTATWSGATFDHDPFVPIHSGAHQGRWSACSDCHVSPTDYRQFTCFSCHPHSDRGETDGHHNDVSGYVYESAACYSCHPRGRH
jgi:hypothetical protein